METIPSANCKENVNFLSVMLPPHNLCTQRQTAVKTITEKKGHKSEATKFWQERNVQTSTDNSGNYGQTLKTLLGNLHELRNEAKDIEMDVDNWMANEQVWESGSIPIKILWEWRIKKRHARSESIQSSSALRTEKWTIAQQATSKPCVAIENRIGFRPGRPFYFGRLGRPGTQTLLATLKWKLRTSRANGYMKGVPTWSSRVKGH